jgi:tetratricopeptide (TPR) repeat protein
MNAPESRLLRRLNARIVGAKDQYSSDCARLERACYMARQGNFAEARLAVDRLRSKYYTQPDVQVTVLANLAEGLISHFSELGEVARDKILRAHALSHATGLHSLTALSAAWLAQMDFSRLDAMSVAVHAAEALRISAPNQHDSRSRASMVVAQALHLSGRWDLAAPWYTRARLHATSDGDDLSISALMHNMVSMRLDQFRQVILTGKGEANEAVYALIGIESSANFDALIGTSTLETLRPLMRARFLSLQERYADAITVYKTVVGTLLVGLSRLESDVMSDVGWCHLKVGNYPQAKEALAAAENALERCAQVDDKAASHTRLRNIYLGLGDRGNAARQHDLAMTAWNEFECIQETFVSSLRDLPLPEVSAGDFA